MDFMGGGDILIREVGIHQLREIIAEGYHPETLLPDVIVLAVQDPNVNDKPSSFVIKSTYKGQEPKKSSKYVLDSAVVRDTEAIHFCSTLTCGGKGMGFDGGSFSRIADFDWKPLINKNEDWSFDGSVWDGTKDQIRWNFRNGYQLLFYYRNS